MASELQVRANRANALKSTGPKSEAGKSVVRFNAQRHGLLSRAPLMAGEDETEYSALWEGLKKELAPVGIMEEQLVGRMAGLLWRLRRLGHIEAGLFTYHAAGAYAQAAEGVAQSHTKTEPGWGIVELELERVTIIDEAAHGQALQAAQEARAVQLSESALLGAAYRNDAAGADAMSKLGRYEVTLERSLFRVREELRRLQEERAEREAEDRARARAARTGAILRRAMGHRAQRDTQSDEPEEAA
jgi:hypothetical protein